MARCNQQKTANKRSVKKVSQRAPTAAPRAFDPTLPSTSSCSPNVPPMEQRFVNLRNCAPLPPLIQFSPAEGFEAVKAMTRAQKQEFFKSQVTTVQFDEREEQISSYLRTLSKIEKDQELNGFFKWDLKKNGERELLAVQARKAVEAMGGSLHESNEKNGRKTSMKYLDQYKECRHYKVPETRTLLTKNLPLNANNPIAVYSDVPGEEGRQIPEALVYQYEDRNFLDGEKEPLLKKAVELAELPENAIQCTCSSQQPIVNCWENSECPCYQMNLKLQRLQGQNLDGEAVMEFKTFSGMKLKSPSEPFFNNVGFACSHACSCRGHCTNNATFLLEKQLFDLEITRNNMIMGFGVRTQSMIPAGSPILEFVGELKEREHVDDENQDYAFQVSYVSVQKRRKNKRCKKVEEMVVEKNFWKLVNEQSWSQEMKDVLNKISKKEYFIDPKFYGNIGRTCLHSCAPNAELFRVFQKSLSPAHLRFVLVATEDIFPGSQITIDYGPQYIEKQFGGNCLCGTFACTNGKHLDYFKSLGYLKLSQYFGAIDEVQRKKFEELKAAAVLKGKKKEEEERSRQSGRLRRLNN